MFSRGRERVHWEAFSNIQLNEYLLTLAKSITYNGVEIEETFSWNNQMKVPAKKFSRSYEILSKLSYYIPTETLTSIYYSLFKWHILYHSTVCCYISKKDIMKIFIVQKTCRRLPTFSDFQEYTTQIFKNFKILKLQDIIKGATKL